MDSVTQFALGSAITVATLGRRTAVWKAALWGGIAGTLPDLDAFVDHGDAILNMVLHRSESHALLYLSILSLPLGWAASRLQRAPQHFARWWLAMWLALVTHPLLDWTTVYGTQLLLPFTDRPYALGSMFIIDPLYTVPLLVGLGVALARRGGSGIAWVRGALVVSMLYIGWGLLAQQWATQRILASPPVPGLQPAQLLVTPAPFNTLLWRAVAVTPTHYYEGYYGLLDGGRPVRWTAHLRGDALYAQHQGSPLVQRVARFSHGFFKMSEENGAMFITDLRMGSEPAYSFHFNLGAPADVAGGGRPATQQWQRPDLATALPWLWQRMWGADVPPPVSAPGGVQ